MFKGLGLLFLQIVLFWCISVPLHAATLYMDPNEYELMRGDTMVVSVRLDTDEGECVNVVDAVITYSENIQLVDTSRGESIMSLWVEEPVIDRANRTVSFAGGIPNGYCGRIAGDPQLTNTVIDLLFQSPGLQIGSSESGNIASIEFKEETNVLLNDGFGTVVAPQRFGSSVILSRDPGAQMQNPWQDTVANDVVPPEQFSITVSRIPDSTGRYHAIFNTTDKQSGIDHYEIIEEPLSSRNLFGWGAETAPWVEAKSPYILDDQSLNSLIRVRAIDKAGNEYIATYEPDVNIRTISEENMFIYAGLAFAGVILLSLIVLAIILTTRRLKKKKAVIKNEDIVIE